MKCKKMMLLASVIGSLTLSSFSHAEINDSITVNFQGSFQGTTCSVTTEGTEASNGGTVDIYLGLYATTALKDAGDTTSAYSVPVVFANCGAITSVSLSFNGEQSTPTIFDVSGDNKGIVGIGLSDSATSTDYFASGQQKSVQIDQDGRGTFTYFARYVKTGDTPVVEGDANATTTLDIVYR